MTVAASSGTLVRLGDIARVEPGPVNDRSVTRYSQQPSVFLGIIRQSKANVIEVAQGVHRELPAVQSALPAGVNLTVAFDGSVFIQRSIREAKLTLLITAGLVIAVIFVFLGTLRATLIPAIAIPVSIITTFAILNGFGYSINTLTLLGLILAIGIVVDDAIIVLENAYRHQEELGKDPDDSGNRRYPRDHDRGHRHDHLPGRRLLAAALPHRHDRAAVQRIRRHDRRRGDRVFHSRADAHTGAVSQDPAREGTRVALPRSSPAGSSTG
jgi:hypothetical protein